MSFIYKPHPFMNLQYLTESILLLPNCSIMTLSGGGIASQPIAAKAR